MADFGLAFRLSFSICLIVWALWRLTNWLHGIKSQ